MDDRGLMELRADTDFTFDGRGRMLATNEPRAQDRKPAPHLFLGWAAGGPVVRFGASLPGAAVERLAALLAGRVGAASTAGGHGVDGPADYDDRQAVDEAASTSGGQAADGAGPRVAGAVDASTTDLLIPAGLLDEVRAVLAEHKLAGNEGGGPAYRFPDPIAPPAGVELITEQNRHTVRATFPWLYDEYADWPPCFAVIQEGAGVSVCFSSRLSAGAAEAGVETLPEHRGRGHAAAVSAAWGSAVRASGRIPIYSTAWDNLASRGVARRLGLVLFGSDATWW